jgi:hypothetical protein
MPDIDHKPMTMNTPDQTALAQPARHRTLMAQVAATVSHDLGNIMTLLQAGASLPGSAGQTLMQDGLARLGILSDVIAALDRGMMPTQTTTLLPAAVANAAEVIRGAFDVDLQMDDAPTVNSLECTIPRPQLTAAVYAALDAAARAARALYPVRLSWIDETRFAGIRIEVPAMIRMRSFERVEFPARHCRFGLEQALTLTHRFGGYGLHSCTEQASFIELRWRKTGATVAAPSGPVIWLGSTQQDVLALVPAVSGWPQHRQLRSLLEAEQGMPRAVVGLVSPDWNDRSLLETLRWLRASGSMVLPLVCDGDAAAFITEEFGVDCPMIRWPAEMDQLNEWATRLSM